MNKPDDTITLDELAQALTYVTIFAERSSVHATYPKGLAEDLFNYAEQNREPEYDDRAVYADAYNEKWLYDGAFRVWYAFATTNHYEFDVPRRPLVKLVPAA
jgi:hypothetical protein